MTDLNMDEEDPQPEPEREPHAYDCKVRSIEMSEATISRSLLMLARIWAILNPGASVEQRQYLAAIVAAELAGR
ncbi:hypothetical protein [Gluconacetobacter entanii]|uniref:Uncharacterized protein n=1 Tax=Gluconacetobacter entanii TaxID=108528 RepID=A0A318PT23_9PROT|nr:hypothetical protein [Gluconacetobacter entanii]MCE2578095.1 hypothetical protein [Komagataeibacter sp. FNDCR1]PYD62288.1 hypothetical protein CFR72_13365 [Gluconacetobacter entanii]